jgi:hypothetical protein
MAACVLSAGINDPGYSGVRFFCSRHGSWRHMFHRPGSTIPATERIGCSVAAIVDSGNCLIGRDKRLQSHHALTDPGYSFLGKPH